MTPSRDPFDLLRADLEHAASQATPKPEPRRRMRRRAWRPALAATTVVLVAGVLLVSTDLRPDGANAVAAATAALDPGDDVLRMVLEGGRVTRSGRPVPTFLTIDGGRTRARLTGRTEQWSTSRPLRSLLRRDIVADRRAGTTGSIDYGLVSTGPRTATGWSDNTLDDERPRSYMVRGLAADGDLAEGALRAVDPAAQIRRQLEAGTFEDTGTVERNGTTVRRLVSTITGKAQSGGYVPDRRLVYLVDPDTSAPREFETLERAPTDAKVPDRLKTFAPAERYVITTYEHLPLDTTTRALFAVPEAARPDRD